MTSEGMDYSILDKFEFKYAPVGVKFYPVKPEGMEKLDKKIAWCQMLIEAQQGEAFYSEAENHFCEPALFLLGHEEVPPLAGSGRLGPALKIFKDSRANRRIYQMIKMLGKGTVEAVAFAPLHKMTFDPDLLILTADNADQTEKIARAAAYSAGEMFNSRMTYVMGCAWLYNYPYVTGEINYLTTGVAYGMKMYELLPGGMQIVSIPYDRIPQILVNLREMPWILPGHTDKKEAFYVQVHKELGLDEPYF